MEQFLSAIEAGQISAAEVAPVPPDEMGSGVLSVTAPDTDIVPATWNRLPLSVALPMMTFRFPFSVMTGVAPVPVPIRKSAFG